MPAYGTFLYGAYYYGISSFPVSATFDVFDFCEPNDSTMLTLFSFPEVSPERYGAPWMWFDGSNNLCMASDDGLDSGFRMDLSVPAGTYTLQFSILPTDLPQDFSDTSTARFYVAVFNQFSSMVGLLLSENEGIALADQGTGTYTKLSDSADIFDEGADYYVFRVACDEVAGTANLFVTRSDVLAATGAHQLRYTFNLLSCPASETDNVRVETVGNSGETVQVCLDCIRLSSQELSDERPIAVIDDDVAQVSGQYAGFDGRGSYDPDGGPIVVYWWSHTSAPENSSSYISGQATSPADATGYTNVLTAAAGTFDSVRVGDILVEGDDHSHVVYVASDGSELVVNNDIIPQNVTTYDWVVIDQSGWGGARLSGDLIYVLERRAAPPGFPSDGDAYLVIATASGDWLGHEGDIATWSESGGTWVFTSPAAGSIIFSIDDSETYRTDGLGFWYEDPAKGWELDYWEGRRAAVGNILDDGLGLHDVELVVNDGDMDSVPATAILNILQSSSTLGLTPDLSFVWNYLSDFWPMVEDREYAESIWSGFAQLSGDLLMQLWQHDYSKSILDIQRTFQVRWLNYDPYYEETSYEELPAAVENAVDAAGYATSPTPGAGVDATRTYVLDGGDMPAGVTDEHYLVLDGIAYKIARIEGDTIVTSDDLPTTDRPNYWMIRPSITSRSSNFSDLGVMAGDTAIFSVRDENGAVTEVSCHIWGVRGRVIIFDDTLVSGSLASSSLQTTFMAVLRRSKLQVNDLVQSIPRLQEIIAISRVEGAPSALNEWNDFRVDTDTTVEGNEVNQIDFLYSWLSESSRGFAGYTDASNREYFYDASADFETTFGAAADLRGYFLELGTGERYRLYQVISATQVELMDEGLALNLTGQTWWIRQYDTPPDHLWAELTLLDNRQTISDNFGRLIGFSLDQAEELTEGLDYLSAVQGLWYFTWRGKTPYNIRVGSQIILGLPFAEVSGTITEIQDPFDSTRSRIVIQDDGTPAVYRSYYWNSDLDIEDNPDTGVAYALGDHVEQFAPLSKGVTVTDYIEDPDWWTVYAGTGDFYEPEKVHTFGVIVNADAFNLTNLLFLVDYIKERRPTYTWPYFVVLKELTTVIDVADPILFGPAVPPAGYTYPQYWPLYVAPPTWADSPHEVPRSLTPTVPPIGVEEWGGLHLRDTPVKVPDGWSGAWASGAIGSHSPTVAEGCFCVDDTDESGHYIHRVDDAVEAGWDPDEELLTDGDMEAVGVTNWLQYNDSIRTKETTDPKEGSQYLRITYDGTAQPAAYQGSILTAGESYRIRGWARGDGTFAPYIAIGAAAVWTGTSSTEWQRIDVNATAASVNFIILSSATAAGYAEFDDVSVTPLLLNDGDMESVGIAQWTAISSVDTLAKSGVQYRSGSQSLHVADDEGSHNLLDDGDMEKEGVTDWSAGNSATLTKETTSPAEGVQCLRVARNAVNNPYAYQNILTVGETYHLTGWARSDGNVAPRVRLSGSTIVWAGTTSTDWQEIDVEFVADYTRLDLTVLTSTGTEYCEFDALSIELVAGCYQDFSRQLDAGYQLAVRGWIYVVSGQAVLRLKDQTADQEVIAELRESYPVGQWTQFTLHAWEAGTFDTNNVRFEALCGPAGGEFYLDDVQGYEKQMPWSQWGVDRSTLGGRTGGYTLGANPDEYWEFGVYGELRLPDEFMDDWNMHATGVADWTAGNSAVRSKETSSPRQGQCLRVAYGGTANPYVRQSSSWTSGVTYRLRGRVRSSGVLSPRIYDAGAILIWQGTTSTEWQEYDVLYTASSSRPYYMGIGSSGYVEWDEVSVVEDLVDDGDMEATGVGAWSTIASATLSKQSTDPAEQLQYLRIARNGVNNPGAYQSILTAGLNYRVRGWARGDGNAYPRIYFESGNIVWEGASSTDWQWFDFVAACGGTGTEDFRLFGITSTGTEYVEFDGVFVQELPVPKVDEVGAIFCVDAGSAEDVTRLSGPVDRTYDGAQLIDDGNMEASGTAAWIVGNSATLSKQGSAYEGSQCLRVARNGVNTPFAYQTTLLTVGETYRIIGWVKSDSNATPRVQQGTTTIWTGTTSTSWQWFDVTFVAVATDIRLVAQTSTGTEYCEFDHFRLMHINNSGVDVWEGPYGTAIESWDDPTHPSYSKPSASWKVDTGIPDGWYTRISRRDTYDS